VECTSTPRPIAGRCRSPAPTPYVGCQRTRSLELGNSARTARHASTRGQCLSTTHLSRSPIAPLSRIEAKTKKAFQGIALEGLMVDDCRASRARDPPCRSRGDRQVDRSTRARTSTSGRSPPARWPDKAAALSACSSNWRIAESIQTSANNVGRNTQSVNSDFRDHDTRARDTQSVQDGECDERALPTRCAEPRE
jgi:hypothetical protein